MAERRRRVNRNSGTERRATASPRVEEHTVATASFRPAGG